MAFFTPARTSSTAQILAPDMRILNFENPEGQKMLAIEAKRKNKKKAGKRSKKKEAPVSSFGDAGDVSGQEEEKEEESVFKHLFNAPEETELIKAEAKLNMSKF